MSGPYCETCEYYREMPFGVGECQDPAKMIYAGKGGPMNTAPEVQFDFYCPNYSEKEINYKYELGELLAILFRDGGHYIRDHGWHRAIRDGRLIASGAVQNSEGD